MNIFGIEGSVECAAIIFVIEETKITRLKSKVKQAWLIKILAMITSKIICIKNPQLIIHIIQSTWKKIIIIIDDIYNH